MDLNATRTAASRTPFRRSPLAVCTAVLLLTLLTGRTALAQDERGASVAAPTPDAVAMAAPIAKPLVPGDFEWTPERSADGPVVVVVSLPEQTANVYRGGVRIGRSTVSSGRAGHETPPGIYNVLQKQRMHHSNLYNNAAMPFMQRLTWDGIALHAGQIPGHPASHGCVRLPLAFAQILYGVTESGVTVVVADETTHGESVLHPGDTVPVDAITGLEPGRTVQSGAALAANSSIRVPVAGAMQPTVVASLASASGD